MLNYSFICELLQLQSIETVEEGRLEAEDHLPLWMADDDDKRSATVPLLLLLLASTDDEMQFMLSLQNWICNQFEPEAREHNFVEEKTEEGKGDIRFPLILLLPT